MMKKWIALIAMLMAVLMLSGCNLIGYDAELDGAQVVATVNGKDLTKAEWIAYRDYLVAYEQEYYQNYFGFSIPVDDEMLASYGQTAIDQMIEAQVIADKMVEMGFDPLDEEHAAEVETYADGMLDMYKMILRYQIYPDLETVEEEQERLAAEAEAAAGEAEAAVEGETVVVVEGEAEETADAPEAAQPVATVTDAELDEMLTNELNAMGYTREYLVQTETATVQEELLFEKVTEGVVVTDDEVKAKFDGTVAQQQTSYDATPTLYANNADAAYYVPAGYRGVKNLLIKISDEAQANIDTLQSTLTTAQSTLASVNTQIEELKAADTSAYDEAALTAHNDQVAALEAEAAQAQTTIDETTPALEAAQEAAFAEILPEAEEVLAKVQAGEDFDALLAAHGDDGGMLSEPAKTDGYYICEGLTLYVPEFQEAAMALSAVGETSGLVKTSYGYHILQYATDLQAGPVEFTEEIKTTLHDEMLTAAKEAAYEAAVDQWVNEADKKIFEKVMK